MARLATLRKSLGYEPRAPRCELCKNYQQGRAARVNGVLHQGMAICKAGSFNILPGGLCDKFRDKKTGETLETNSTTGMMAHE